MRVDRFLVITMAIAAMVAIALPARCDEPAAKGFISKGTGTVRLIIPNINGITPPPMNAGVTLAGRNGVYRLDLISLTPGAQFSTGMINLSNSGMTLVIDMLGRSMTVWSESTQRYAVVDTRRRAASALTPTSTALRLSDLQQLSMSLTLAGHGTTNGHPTLEMDYSFHYQPTGKPTMGLDGKVFLAEDMQGTPVAVELNVMTGLVGFAIRYDATTVDRTPPEETFFAVPDGFTHVDNVKDVFAHPTPTPTPTPSQT